MSKNSVISPIRDILDITAYAEVAYRRTDLECGFGEMWDITTPDEQTTIRLCDNDGQIELYLFTGGRAQINSGSMTFRHHMAGPIYVAAALDQLAAEFL